MGYDHLFMGNANHTFISTGLAPKNIVGAGALDRIVDNVDMITTRINYRWGDPAAPKH
jgi:hypothetical protein